MPKRNIESSPLSSDQKQLIPPNKRCRLPVLLDHTSFPHIFDAILEAALDEVPLSDLLNFRLVSRDLCTWADARIAHHVLIDARPKQRESVSPTPTTEQPPGSSSFSSDQAGEHPHCNTTHDSDTDCQHPSSIIGSSSRHSSWPSVFMVDLSASKTQLVPLPALRPRSSSDGRGSQWLLDRNPFSGVKIVDVIGPVLPQLRLLSGLQLQTVRFLDAALGFPECSLHAETAVLFTRPIEPEDIDQVSHGSKIAGLKRIINNVTLPEPCPDNRFHYTPSDSGSDTSDPSTIRYDVTAVWCPNRIPAGPRPPVEVVYIFDPAWRHLPTHRMFHDLDILHPLYLGASTLLPDTRFVFVGLEAVPLAALGMDPENMSVKLAWWRNNYTNPERLESLAKGIMGDKCETRRTFDSIDLQWTLSQLDIPEDMPIDQVRLKLQQTAPDPLEEDKRLFDYKMAKIRETVCSYVQSMRYRSHYLPGHTEADYPDHPYREETWPDERIEAMVADGIVAYTYDEYRARVGEAQWRMETGVYDFP